MFNKRISSAVAAGVLALTPVAAPAQDLGAAIVGGIIGGVIVGEVARNNQRNRARATVTASSRAETRNVQTALNFFDFPAGAPDGVAGRQTRNAIASYQAFMGFPVTGALTTFERDFLVNSHFRAQAGGAATYHAMATNPMGARGLLVTYREELAGGGSPGGAPFAGSQANPFVSAPSGGDGQTGGQGTMAAAAPADPSVSTRGGEGLPVFARPEEGPSLASHCNTVSLLTTTNGGFVTLASMSDPVQVVDEQFCLARTYAIADGEALAERVARTGAAEVRAQCEGLAPAMATLIAGVQTNPREEVLRDTAAFVVSTGMTSGQIATTGRICLSVGYRIDRMDVAMASALLLVASGQSPYSELLGHHLQKGFGVAARPDLARRWYSDALDAIEAGAEPVFTPGQPERTALLRAATDGLAGNRARVGSTPTPVALPSFTRPAD